MKGGFTVGMRISIRSPIFGQKLDSKARPPKPTLRDSPRVRFALAASSDRWGSIVASGCSSSPSSRNSIGKLIVCRMNSRTSERDGCVFGFFFGHQNDIHPLPFDDFERRLRVRHLVAEHPDNLPRGYHRAPVADADLEQAGRAQLPLVPDVLLQIQPLVVRVQEAPGDHVRLPQVQAAEEY